MKKILVVLLLLHHGVYFLHGCCDGLLLLSQRSYRPRQFLVYNPTTREHATLPPDLDCS
jgi:hypothetical protein